MGFMRLMGFIGYMGFIWDEFGVYAIYLRFIRDLWHSSSFSFMEFILFLGVGDRST